MWCGGHVSDHLDELVQLHYLDYLSQLFFGHVVVPLICPAHQYMFTRAFLRSNRSDLYATPDASHATTVLTHQLVGCALSLFLLTWKLLPCCLRCVKLEDEVDPPFYQMNFAYNPFCYYVYPRMAE